MTFVEEKQLNNVQLITGLCSNSQDHGPEIMCFNAYNFVAVVNLATAERHS